MEALVTEGARFRLLHRRCGRTAGYVSSIHHALSDLRSSFHWSDGVRHERAGHAICEFCKCVLSDGNEIQAVREPSEAAP